MSNYTDLSAMYDEAIDPATVDFTTKPGKTCKGCLWSRQRASVCNQVEEICKREGIARCSLVDVIYVRRVVDGRQLKIESEAA